MDHRWDESLERERAARAEQERYGNKDLERDLEVERRDRGLARRRLATSPWEIGAAHWDQRDSYTRNPRTDEGGYGVGPRLHPDIGSYAYPRDSSTPEHVPQGPRELYAGEAWPWRHYAEAPVPLGPPAKESLWRRVQRVFRREHAPLAWRSDVRIQDEVSDAIGQDGRIDATDITVSVKSAVVTLEGSVPDAATKELAGKVAAASSEVRGVHNRLRVQSDDTSLGLGVPIRAM